MGRLLFCLCIALFVAGCNPNRNEPDTLRIAVIPKGTTHTFWKSVHAGALKAEREIAALGSAVEVIWKGPLLEDDRAHQISVVENFIAQRVDGIVLAPLDRKALVAPVRSAGSAGIPVVVIDSDLDDDTKISFAATDNFRGGQIGGEHLAALLGGKGKVIMLRLMSGHASTEARERGFLDIMERFPEIELLSTNQHGGVTRETAFTAAENLLNRFGSEVDGIFAPNESTTNGMLLAIRSLGLTGRVRFVGFDGGEQNVEGLKKGEIQGLVLQDPFQMGYLGVKLIVDHIQGKQVDIRVDTGATLVSKENFEQPEIKNLLYPPLQDYLP